MVVACRIEQRGLTRSSVCFLTRYVRTSGIMTLLMVQYNPACVKIVTVIKMESGCELCHLFLKGFV